MKYILLFVTMMVCPCAHLWAQFEEFNKYLEKTIKTSGEYYYGDGVDKDETNAQAMAVEDMKLMIDEKMKVENPGVEKVVFSSSLDKNVGYAKYTSMGRVRMVAYIAKEHVTTTKTATTITVGAKGNKAPAGTTPSSDQATAQQAEQIIKELSSMKKSADAEQYLNTQKNKGTLMVGRISTLQAAQNCYFIIIRSGEMVDILDKGDSPVRKGLVTGNQTDYTSVPAEEIYWLLIF